MTPQKYCLKNSVVFYAATIQQIKRFLEKNGFTELEKLKELLVLTDVNESIDFNLVKLVQNKHVLEGLIPFVSHAEVDVTCPFLAKIPSHSGDRRSKEMYLINHYFCTLNFCKIKAAQLDPEYAILQSCFPCGSFVSKFNEMLNKAIR